MKSLDLLKMVNDQWSNEFFKWCEELFITQQLYLLMWRGKATVMRLEQGNSQLRKKDDRTYCYNNRGMLNIIEKMFPGKFLYLC